MPKVLADLDYDHYRDIRVRPSSTLWADKGTEFRLQLLPRGFVFTDPVEVALVAGGRCQRIAYKPDFFVTGDVMKAPLPNEDIGFSGFRVLFPINRRSVFDEVAVFQGASYFRSLGEKQVYGLSARGLANKTAEPEGEEFPAFRAFWIEEPSSRASQTLVVHALLDSPSVAGAYRFAIHPAHGATRATTMDVEAVLFPRVELGKVGLAPADQHVHVLAQRPRSRPTTFARRFTIRTACSCSTGAASTSGGRCRIRRRSRSARSST